MCLLAVLSRAHPDSPLVVAANRDEWLARPAVAMTRLSDSPRILGGRDLLAGGTWLAVNEHGVVAALTNRPAPGGRDPTKRSRGELPLRLAAHRSAEEAVEALAREIDPAAYNPCWVVAGDRRSLHYLELGEGPLVAEALPPGLWVLENRPLGARSPKANAIREALAGAASWRGAELSARLEEVLRSHRVPDESEGERSDPPRPPEVDAACVHAGPYGTRSSAIAIVPPGPGLPAIRFSDGPPCTNPYRDASSLW